MLTFTSDTSDHMFIRTGLTRAQVEKLGQIANRRGTNIAVTNPYGRNVTRKFRAFATTPARYLAA